MTARAEALLALLADGSLHSGAGLAEQLGVSRAAVWKLVGELRGHGIAVESLPRRGYRLPAPGRAARRRPHRRRCRGTRAERCPDRVEVLFEIDSTNTYSAGRCAAGARSAAQSLRGDAARRAGPARSVLARAVRVGADVLRGLDVRRDAIGPAGARTRPRRRGRRGAARLGVDGGAAQVAERHRLARRKLGGLLLQLRTESGGPASVVAGLGPQPRCCRSRRASARRATARYRSRTSTRRWPGGRPGRNDLAAALVVALLAALAKFARDGFAPFAPRWAALDALAGARVRVAQGADGRRGRSVRCGRGRRAARRGGRPNRALPLGRREPAPGGGMTLLVDIGNSRVKWARLGADGVRRAVGRRVRGLVGGRTGAHALFGGCAGRARARRERGRGVDRRGARSRRRVCDRPSRRAVRRDDARGGRRAERLRRPGAARRGPLGRRDRRLCAGRAAPASSPTSAPRPPSTCVARRRPAPRRLHRARARGSWSPRCCAPPAISRPRHAASGAARADAGFRRQHPRRDRARLPPRPGGPGRSECRRCRARVGRATPACW